MTLVRTTSPAGSLVPRRRRPAKRPLVLSAAPCKRATVFTDRRLQARGDACTMCGQVSAASRDAQGPPRKLRLSDSPHATTAVVSAKGGVGKTTTAVNLGAALAVRGHNVLVVDLDCQASASLSLGLKRHQLAPSAADVLLRGEAAGAAVRPTKLPGLWVLPASADLASVEADLAPLRTKERVLARALEPLRERFEHIVIDCPPGLGLLSRNALVAADCYIVLVVPHYLAVEGLENLVQAVARLDFRAQSRTQLIGVVPTMVDLRLKTVRQFLEAIRASFGQSVFCVEV